MKEEYIAVGKNVDNAIANGLLEIGKTREEVDIKILETGGLFKKAKVVLIYDKMVEIEQDNQPLQPEIEKEEARLEQEEIETNEIKVEDEIEVIHNIDEVVDENEVENKEIVDNFEKETVDVDKLAEKVTNFLNGIIEKYNIEATVSSEAKNKEIYFNISGENVGKLIGYRGDNLNAIQYLMGCLKEGAENRYRLYLDVENYKAKREETLVELANKMADKAEDIERNVHLDPMNAYERRIIHTSLQNREKVETESMGEGEKRHVVIKFKR